jgi:arylsulfatase A-like enzyme
MRAAERLTRLTSLSPEASAFFYVSAIAHVALKLLLGLTLVYADGYGWKSLVAPPQSLVFAGADLVFCFVFAKLLTHAIPMRQQRPAQGALLLLLFVFLTASFVIHGYFKTFLNRGLLEFNGASAVELIDYTRAAATAYSISFVLLVSGMFALYLARFRTFVGSRWMARAQAPFCAALGGLGAMVFVGTLSQGQTGFLAYNPEFQLLKSYASEGNGATPTASPAEARAFRDPAESVRGQYPAAGKLPPLPKAARNVLFVLIESLPFEQTSLARSDGGGMPVLAELAQNGIAFDNFRTVFPATSRSFMTYHCGIYPSPGAATATKYRPGYRCDSILDGLKARGYRTGFFTAPMFTYDNLHKAEFMRGYDVYQDFLSLRAHARKDALDAPAVEEEVVADALLSFTQRDPARPFFATYFMFWNHAPYRLPFEDISQLKPLARYQRGLAYLDRVLRSVLDGLRAQGNLDNTLIMVAADHGEGFALHHANTNHVGHLYEDDVRIPLLIHLPSAAIGPQRSHRQGSNVDFAPTLFALLGLPGAPSWQGQDLLSDDFQSRPTLVFGRAAYTTNAIVDGNLKYIEYPNTKQHSLFDLSRDPHEQHDLSARHKADADAYAQLLPAWLRVAEYRSWQVSETSAQAPRSGWLKRVAAH